jgi:hypothetical protein
MWSYPEGICLWILALTIPCVIILFIVVIIFIFIFSSLPLSPLLAYQVPCGRLIVFSSFSPLFFSLGGVAGVRDTFPGHPRPPSPLLSPFWTTQYEHNTTSMGGPSGRDLNPADLAVTSEECRSSFHHPSRQSLTHIHGPAEVPSLEKMFPLWWDSNSLAPGPRPRSTVSDSHAATELPYCCD